MKALTKNKIRRKCHFNYSICSKPAAISKQEQPQQNLLTEAHKKNMEINFRFFGEGGC